MEQRLFRGLSRLDDAGIVQACKAMFRNQMNQDPEASDALGAEHDQRLERRLRHLDPRARAKDGRAVSVPGLPRVPPIPLTHITFPACRTHYLGGSYR